MRTSRLALLTVAAVLWAAAAEKTWAVSPTADEMAMTRQWAAAEFGGVEPAKPMQAGRVACDATSPFSFTLGGRPSAELLKTWELKRETRQLDPQRTQHTLVYVDLKTGLVLRCLGIEYRDFPAVEWVLRFQNTGRADTPILEAVQAMDTLLPIPKAEQPVLHWAKGGVASFDDFAPQETVLKGGAKMHFQPGGGRSSNQVMPLFNLAAPGGGVVIAVGWSGEWAADFVAARGGVTLKAGMARTRLLLHPGEAIRTPRMLVLFYEQDRWRGQNLLRQLILAHYRPKRDGQPLLAPITWGTWGGSRADVHLDYIQKIIEHQLPVDYYWMDAEWYGGVPWHNHVGNWQVRKDLFPNGLKPLSDTLRASGRHLMLWFEPERVVKGTPWHKEHREWLLDTGGGNCLLNLGDPAARKFLTDFISAKIAEFGLGCYRQDFNIDPLPFWRAADPRDREGISEIRYIEGLYAFWDELLARHPGLIIDNCASGGRRIDLETTARSTPFWRTDGPRDPVAHQCHTYGLMPWVPLSSTSQDREGNVYEFRSSISSALCVNWFHSGDGPMKKLPADFPFAWGKQVLDQYLKLRPFYYGDYYSLTPYSKDRTQWMAWQFDRPGPGDGMVQAFRREKSDSESASIKLHGLQPDARYTLTDLDVPGTKEMIGRELLDAGLPIAIKNRPGAVIVTYKRTAPPHTVGKGPVVTASKAAFRVKRRVLRDSRTGREVWQVSPENASCVASYMYITSFAPDERFLFYVSDRSGSRQLYRLEIETGETIQLTEATGISGFGANLHPDGRSLLYRDGQVYRAVDLLTGEERIVLDTTKYAWLRKPGEQITFSKSGHFFSLSFEYADGKRAVARAACDGSSVEELYRYGEQTQHVQFCPGDEDLLTFAVWPDYQNTPDLPDSKRARAWLLDARTRTARPFLVMPPGTRATHEYWGSTGQRMYFHKKTVRTWVPTWICSLDRATGKVRDIFGSKTIKLGHSFINRDETKIVADSQEPGRNELLLIDVASGRAEVLCWPNSSITGQNSHVHPSFSPSGRFIVYTSDCSGRPQVYLVPLR